MRCLLLICLTLISACFGLEEEAYEELWIRTLDAERKVATEFEFTLKTGASPPMHTNLFPKSIAQILHKYQAEELKVTLSNGHWDVNKWGIPLSTGPYGAEIWAMIKGETPDLQRQRWHGLKAEIAAIFSVSLSKLDDTRMPDVDPHFVASNITGNGRFFYGILPREEVCTENLTPWMKLLACRSHAGLGQLINPIRIAGSDYNSISLHAARSPSGFKLKQTLTNVFRLAENGVTLAGIFDKSTIRTLKACPTMQYSRIYVEIDDISRLVIRPKDKIDIPKPWHSSTGSSKKVGMYEVTKDKYFDTNSVLYVLTKEKRAVSNVFVHRYLTGYGQVRGGLALRIANHHPTDSVNVRYHENVPWFFRCYFHTMKLGMKGKVVGMDAFRRFEFVPAEDHGRPNALSFETTLEPLSDLVVSVQFEKAFVPFEEHPPDANRGEDISSGIATIEPFITGSDEIESDLVSRRSAENAPIRLYTRPLLAQLPTPDFSMPYNVITLTSTVIAFFLGGILNTLLRRKKGGSRLEAARDERDMNGLKGWLKRIKLKLPLKLKTKTD